MHIVNRGELCVVLMMQSENDKRCQCANNHFNKFLSASACSSLSDAVEGTV